MYNFKYDAGKIGSFLECLFLKRLQTISYYSCIMFSHSCIFEILLEMFAGIFELKNKANT